MTVTQPDRFKITRRTGTAPHLGNRGTAPTPALRTLGATTGTRGPGAQAQLATIFVHAELEAPALLVGALFLLCGTDRWAWLVLPVSAVGVSATWPRREWLSNR